jgi:hypothetical protein
MPAGRLDNGEFLCSRVTGCEPSGGNGRERHERLSVFHKYRLVHPIHAPKTVAYQAIDRRTLIWPRTNLTEAHVATRAQNADVADDLVSNRNPRPPSRRSTCAFC